MNEKIRHIVLTFAAARGMSEEIVMSNTTLRPVCVTRYMIYSFLRCKLNISASDIGEYFGRTRINVLRGIRVLRGWCRYHDDIKQEYREVMKKLEEAD